MEIPCGIPCRTQGLDVLEQAGTALGIGWVLPTLWGCSLYFCQGLGTSVSWQALKSHLTPNQSIRGAKERGDKMGQDRENSGAEAGAASAALNPPHPSLGLTRAASGTRGSCCWSQDCLSWGCSREL